MDRQAALAVLEALGIDLDELTTDAPASAARKSTKPVAATRQVVRDWMAAHPVKDDGTPQTYTHARIVHGLTKAQYKALPDGGKARKAAPATSTRATVKSSGKKAKRDGSAAHPFAGFPGGIHCKQVARDQANRTGTPAFYLQGSQCISVLPDATRKTA